MFPKTFLDISKTQNFKQSMRKIWWMNIGVSETSANEVVHFFPRVKKGKEPIVTATEQLCLFQANQDDIVILRETPPPEIIESLKQFRGYVPMILYSDDRIANFSENIWKDSILLCKIKAIVNNNEKSFRLIPFKITEYDIKISEFLGVELYGNIPDINEDINDKIVSRKICVALGGKVTKGYECYNIKEIQDAIDALYPENVIVAKEYDGISGQGLFVIDNVQSLNIFKAILRRHKYEEKIRMLIEKWYQDCININYQMYIGESQEIIQAPPTIQIVENGVYKGTSFQTKDCLEEKDFDEIKSFGHRLGEYLYQTNYRGNISIDAIKVGKQLFHVVEINARLSLSSYFWGIFTRYKDKKIVVQYYDVKNCHFSLKSFYDKLCSNNDKKGILILSAGCDRKEDIQRIYLLFYADEEYQLQQIKEQAEKVIQQR